MNDSDLIRALRRIKVETGSLVCWGCGHEHNCSTHGCAVINEAIERIQSIAQRTTLDGTYVSVEWFSKVKSERDAAINDLHKMHTLCMKVGSSCPECGDQIDDLLDAACEYCSRSGFCCWVDDPDNADRCAAFSWRGLEKAVSEKGGDTNETTDIR